MKIWKFTGIYGSIDIQAPTPELAADLYLTLAGWKAKVKPPTIDVKCDDTDEEFCLDTTQRMRPVKIR
jgi:hypothetical protein